MPGEVPGHTWSKKAVPHEAKRQAGSSSQQEKCAKGKGRLDEGRQGGVSREKAWEGNKGAASKVSRFSRHKGKKSRSPLSRVEETWELPSHLPKCSCKVVHPPPILPSSSWAGRLDTHYIMSDRQEKNA